MRLGDSRLSLLKGKCKLEFSCGLMERHLQSDTELLLRIEF